MAQREPTLSQLRAEAKAKGIVGYSKLRKAELLQWLAHPEGHMTRKTPARAHMGPTVKQLQQEAKARGLKGFYGRNKAELEAMLGRGGVAQATARMSPHSPYARRR